jgi:hypothetical protein
LQNDLGSLYQLDWCTTCLLNGLQKLIFLILKGSGVYCRFGTPSKLVLVICDTNYSSLRGSLKVIIT